ncbi:MAG: response regulator transcription factor [Gammaproteobacteria bacterium]|nr:response regulator transcription factor [Gammaproteobacteria bacterium]
MRILIVEDNRRLNTSLKTSLEEDGYAVDAVYDGDEGEAFALAAPYDLILLDVMLPKKDGFSLCRDLRQQGINAPVLMLTARDAIDDRVDGLDSGADDYLVKPFSMNELRARLRALLRRNKDEKTALLQVGDLAMDPANHHVQRGNTSIDLTPREFAILEYMMRSPNRILTREMIEAHVWNFDFISGSNVVDVYIRRLRRKIDDPYELKLVETVRGVGYRLTPPAKETNP